MRLLQETTEGEFRLTEPLAGADIPRYAILSHTWDKEGYGKLRLCANKASAAGLEYFWVDTCCINKADSSELSEAINSMYAWYRNAAACFVLLSEAWSSYASDGERWLAIRSSRWFTRGWTLQELLAPPYVKFYSWDGKLLGDRWSMGQDIQDLTGIPVSALRGEPLGNFSVEERLRWADPATAQCLHTLKGHWRSVNSVSFSPDLRLLASAADDTTVKLWDLAMARCLHTLTDHQDEVKSVAFSPDSRLLASGSGRLHRQALGSSNNTVLTDTQRPSGPGPRSHFFAQFATPCVDSG